MTVTVISTSSSRYSQISKGFFIPFDNYSQIIEKGSNYFQFLPAGSFINESDVENVNTYFDLETIPVLVISNEEKFGSFSFNYIMGVQSSLTDEL